MENSRTFDIQIPFPAWDGIHSVAAICNELRQHELLRGAPVNRTPRRITMKQISDTVVRVDYWYTAGQYATAVMFGSENGSYGTSWEITSLKLKFRDFTLQARGVDQVRIEIGSADLKAIRLAAYRRANIHDVMYGNSHRQAIEDEAAELAVILGNIAAQVGA